MKRKPAAPAAMAFYAYLIGRTADIRKAMEGNSPPALDDGSEIQFVAEGDIAAVICALPLETYGEGRFEEKLQYPVWTAEKVMRHQAVAEFFSRRHPIIPLRFGAMYSSVDKVRKMLRDRANALRAALDRVEGCDEWGLNIYADKAALSAILDALSPKLAELKLRAGKASQGQAYLLKKQADKLRAGEMKRHLERTSNEIAAAMEPHAVEARRAPVGEVEARQDPVIAGKAAYLVKRTKLRSFKAAAEKIAAKHAKSGFKLELTGPWPPYNFIE